MEQINKYANSDSLNTLLSHLLDSFIKISHLLQNSTGGKLTDTQNQFGDHQLDTDIECDKIIFNALQQSGVVSHALSEEKPELQQMGKPQNQYKITFDPLDGSSIIDVNWAVGTIFGIWQNDERKLIGHTVSEQITAGVVNYGPRTTIILYNNLTDKVEEWTMHEFENQQKKWIRSKDDLKIQEKAKIFSPGNLRASTELPQYKQCIQYWIDNGYTLRYTGGMVPDICQIFVKGQGIFTNIGSKSHKAKLRLLYEVGPFSFLVQKAGGLCCDENNQDMMQTKVESYDQRTSVVLGSKSEVQRVQGYLAQK